MGMTLKEFVERSRSVVRPDTRPRCARCGRPIDEHTDEAVYTVGAESEGLIRIITVPAGRAPLWVRRASVGLNIPTVCYESKTCDGKDVLTGKPIEPAPHYLVLQRDFIEALEKRNVRAADWWKRRSYPNGDECFAFNPDEVIEIERVSPRY